MLGSQAKTIFPLSPMKLNIRITLSNDKSGLHYQGCTSTMKNMFLLIWGLMWLYSEMLQCSLASTASSLLSGAHLPSTEGMNE